MSAAGKASTRFSVLPGLLCDGSMWTGVIAPLSERGDVRVADFSTQDSIMAMAQTALALFDGPMIAVGHSMGGRVALEMTRLMPERIAALVLLDTGLHPKRDGEEVNRQKLVDLAYQDGMAALADAWLPPMVLESRHNEAALMVPLREMVLRSTPDRHERQIRALLGRPDGAIAARTVRCPTLIIVGEDDRWSPPAQHREIASLIPGSKLVVIPACGHMAPAERPESVAQAIDLWLDSF